MEAAAAAARSCEPIRRAGASETPAGPHPLFQLHHPAWNSRISRQRLFLVPESLAPPCSLSGFPGTHSVLLVSKAAITANTVSTADAAAGWPLCLHGGVID